jgi:hypothetical protein
VIRQAHTYMVGAVSGATLIAIAIAVFVLLVSAQVFRDWPIAALGDGGGSTGVSDARAASSGPAVAAPASAAATAKSAHAPTVANGRAGGSSGAGGAANTGSVGGSAATPAGQVGGGPEEGANGGGSGGGGSPTTSSPPSQTASSNPSGSSNSGGGGKGTGGSAATTPSGQLSETVNDTVNTVDQTVTGGALEKTGVSGATEGLVNGVVGPESTVGKVVDETVGAVEGLLHPHH